MCKNEVYFILPLWRYIVKKFLVLLTFICVAITTITTLAESSSSTDILDNSVEQEEVKEIGIPTEAIVNELKENADTLYENEDYEKACEAYHETAEKANYLANIMRQCIEPYYSSKNDNPNLPDIIRDDLSALEEKSNDMINIRDLCYVYEGVCYNKIGDSENALAVLYRALDIITDRETEAWVLAAGELMNLIQYEAIGTAYIEEREKAEEYIGKPFSELVEEFGEPESSIDLEEEYGAYSFEDEFKDEMCYFYRSFSVYTKLDSDNVEIVDSIY